MHEVEKNIHHSPKKIKNKARNHQAMIAGYGLAAHVC